MEAKELVPNTVDTILWFPRRFAGVLSSNALLRLEAASPTITARGRIVRNSAENKFLYRLREPNGLLPTRQCDTSTL